jgi:hypothetical protein
MIRMFGEGVALALSSALFGELCSSAGLAAVCGLVFGLLVLRRGQLFDAVAGHASANAAIAGGSYNVGQRVVSHMTVGRNGSFANSVIFRRRGSGSGVASPRLSCRAATTRSPLGIEGAMRRPDPQGSSLSSCGTAVLQIRSHHSTDVRRQRQTLGTRSFTAHDDLAAAPVDTVEPKRSDFAQAILPPTSRFGARRRAASSLGPKSFAGSSRLPSRASGVTCSGSYLATGLERFCLSVCAARMGIAF